MSGFQSLSSDDVMIKYHIGNNLAVWVLWIAMPNL